MKKLFLLMISLFLLSVASCTTTAWETAAAGLEGIDDEFESQGVYDGSFFEQ